MLTGQPGPAVGQAVDGDGSRQRQEVDSRKKKTKRHFKGCGIKRERDKMRGRDGESDRVTDE